MIELGSGQLLSIALAVSAVTMAAVGAVFWLVIRAIGHRRGAGWSGGWILTAITVGLAALLVRFPLYESAFSLAATAAASLAGFSHAAAAYRFGQNRRTPRRILAALGVGTLICFALWLRFNLTAPLLAPEFGLCLATACNAVALYPLSRDRRRGGVRTAFWLSVILALVMFRTPVFALILSGSGRVLSPLYWVIEIIAGALLGFVLAMGEIVAILDEVRLELLETNTSLERAMIDLETAAKIDILTGLHNRYAFFTLQPVLEVLGSRGDGSIAILDLNNLKKINDTYGHQSGDEALRNVANKLKEVVRSSDFVFRWGGDEFVIVMRGMSLETARERLVRMQAPAPLAIAGAPEPVQIAVSWGVAPLKSDLDEALRDADAQLYRQKNVVKSLTPEIPAP